MVKKAWHVPLFPDGVGPKKNFWWFSGPKFKMLSTTQSDWAKKVFSEHPYYLYQEQLYQYSKAFYK